MEKPQPKNTSADIVNSPGVSVGQFLSSIDVITIAILELGGDSNYVNTEDIAMKANDLSPGRFTWVKYKDQINIHTIMTHLWDAKSERKGTLLLGSEKEGWMLTSAGLELARKKIGTLDGVRFQKKKLSASEKQWMRTERGRMLGTEAFRKFTDGCVSNITHDETEAFFRLNAYVVGKARERKIARVLNIFGDDKELGTAVKALAEAVRQR